jgi:hypothetical protein
MSSSMMRFSSVCTSVVLSATLNRSSAPKRRMAASSSLPNNALALALAAVGSRTVLQAGRHSSSRSAAPCQGCTWRGVQELLAQQHHGKQQE